MNNLLPEASQIESIQASPEYQSAQSAVESLRDLKGSIVEVCDFVFDNSLSAQEQLALIDSSLDRSLLNSYIESYVDVAQNVLDYIYILEDTIDQNPDAQRLVEFLRAEIADLNNELVDFDSVDQYPELRVFIDLNSVLVIAIQKPWMILNRNYRESYLEAMETYVSEFSRIRRERLAQELGVEIEAAEFRKDLDINQKVQLILKDVYKGVTWTSYRLRGGMWAEGSRGDMTEEMFLDSDLADSLNVALREYLQKGYEVTPIVNMIGGYNGKDSMVPFSMYDIAFEISNGVEAQVVRPVDVEQFYHPLLHGRKGLEDKHPLEQMNDIDFRMQTILKETPVWDGNLESLKEIRINISSFEEFSTDLELVSSVLSNLMGLIDRDYLESAFGGWDFREAVNIDAVNLAIVRLRESGNSELKDYALRAKSVIDKYNDYKAVFDLISELQDEEFVDADSKVEQVMAKAREVQSSLMGSQSGVSSESGDVGESGEEGQEDYNDESDSGLEDEGSGSDDVDRQEDLDYESDEDRQEDYNDESDSGLEDEGSGSDDVDRQEDLDDESGGGSDYDEEESEFDEQDSEESEVEDDESGSDADYNEEESELDSGEIQEESGGGSDEEFELEHDSERDLDDSFELASAANQSFKLYRPEPEFDSDELLDE